MRLLITGATGFLGSRFATVLDERGHEVVGVTRRTGQARAVRPPVPLHAGDVGDDVSRELVHGRDAVLHFAGVPNPRGAGRDPVRTIRENVGTTIGLLETCADDGRCGLVYPSTVRAAIDPPPDVYALSKRLGEQACGLHPAAATVVRLTSVFGPGQLASEGATGAIANFAARALEDEPIVIPGDPHRTRDFLYVDDAVLAVEALVAAGRWNESVTLANGAATSLLRAAELVRDAAGSSSPIETPGGELPGGENESYAVAEETDLPFGVRPLEEGIRLYVDWLRSHLAAQGRARA
jgi:nucleoside-diphosphate-sugar epimerase